MIRKFYTISLMALLMLFAVQPMFGQGTTSARIAGKVVSGSETLIGATVLAVHTPTGSRYGATTNTEGLFTLNNMRVGGPYTITVTYVGYENLVLENINLALGQTETFNFEMKSNAVTTDEIVVTAGGLFDGNRTGAETKVSSETLKALPNADRNFNDYLRVAPQASIQGNGGVSFTGINNRYNAVFIDGAVNNDVFGLANSGTNGGQAGISPISPDALEEIQIVLAPYDVTLGGFAGGYEVFCFTHYEPLYLFEIIIHG